MDWVLSSYKENQIMGRGYFVRDVDGATVVEPQTGESMYGGWKETTPEYKAVMWDREDGEPGTVLVYCDDDQKVVEYAEDMRERVAAFKLANPAIAQEAWDDQFGSREDSGWYQCECDECQRRYDDLYSDDEE